jgi:hypothetical protein
MHDRAVVDLRAEHARADDEGDDREHHGQPESYEDRLRPVFRRHAEAAAQHGQADHQQRQRDEQEEPSAAEEAASRDPRDRLGDR